MSNLFSLVNKTRARRNTDTWFIDINVHMPSRVSDVFYLVFFSFFALVLDFFVLFLQSFSILPFSFRFVFNYFFSF